MNASIMYAIHYSTLLYKMLHNYRIQNHVSIHSKDSAHTVSNT